MVVLGDGKHEERGSTSRFAEGDHVAHQGSADTGTAVPVVYRDRHEVGERRMSCWRIEQSEPDSFSGPPGNSGHDVGAHQEPFHDGSVTAEVRERLCSQRNDERGIRCGSGANRQPRPIFRTIAHSASVTG